MQVTQGQGLCTAYYNISFAYQVVMGTLCTFVEGMHFQLLVKGVQEWGLGRGVVLCNTKVSHQNHTLLRLLRQHTGSSTAPETFKRGTKRP